MVAAKRKNKNPIDPVTGKPRRGRPPKVKPLVEPYEAPVEAKDIPETDMDAIVVKHLNPTEEVSTELAQQWMKRFKGNTMMDVPEEIRKQYPDGQFCWARDERGCINKYRTQYGYEPVNTAKPLPGQTDSAFKFGDVVLMVRPQWMKKLHDKARRDAVLQQVGSPPGARQVEREALQDASKEGYGSYGRNVSFFDEEGSSSPEEIARDIAVAKAAAMNSPGRVRLSSGTKYVFGGIPK